MRAPCSCLALLCCLFAAAANLVRDRTAALPAEALEQACRAGNSETRLACGLGVVFKNSGFFELELIPGISDRLASRILEQRRSIRAAALRLPPAKRWQALTSIKGIGAKSAVKFAVMLDFE